MKATSFSHSGSGQDGSAVGDWTTRLKTSGHLASGQIITNWTSADLYEQDFDEREGQLGNGYLD